MDRTLDTLSAVPAGPAAVEAAPQFLTGFARAQVLRMHASVLLFFAIDGLLLTGYGWAGTIGWSAGALYGAIGCSGSAAALGHFWHRGGRMAALDRLTLGLTVYVGLVMLTTLAALPQVGGLMLLSMMAVVSLSAVQLTPRQLLLLCLGFAAASVAVLAATGEVARIPGASTAERALTGAWFAWLLVKASAHNAVGRQLRHRADQANAKLAKALRELEQIAATDELTLLPNRRAIVGRLKEALEQAPVDPNALAGRVGVAVLDIDDFKGVNDRHGHEVGDQVLRIFAELASASLPPDGRLGRYGGEEFLLVLQRLPDTRAAAEATERIRLRVAAHDWQPVAPGLAVTVSAGVAVVWPDETSGAAIQRADAALYDAKHQGRNRVVLRPEMTRLG